jgi:tetratricopeptide (TPR) repeat protein
MAAEVSIFASDIGSLGLVKQGDEYSIIAITGGRPNGAATGGDCVIKALLHRKDSRLEGELQALTTGVSEYNERTAKGRQIRVSLNNDATLRIDSIDDYDMCGLGVTFVNSYTRLQKGTEELESEFDALFDLVYEDALSFYNRGQLDLAIKNLSPYVEAYEVQWLKNGAGGSRQVRYVNDYGFFLQRAGASKDAVKILEKVVRVAPERTVAWLNLADAYWDSKHTDEAKAAYRRYLKLLGGNSRVDHPARVDQRVGL